jgi:peptide/nickel transport system substrate-binding protein
MRMKRSAVVVATAALLTLAACGGSGGSNGGTNNPSGGFSAGGNAGAFKDPNDKAPMAIPAGAKPGGVVTVMTAGAPSTFDPTEA